MGRELMLMTKWYLVYSAWDGPTYRVVRPHYDEAGNQVSWVEQNGVHTAVYKDDKVMQISEPVEWKIKAGQVWRHKEVTSYRVMITTPALRQDLEGLAPDLQVGAVNKETDGWRFIPWTDSHKPSRKGWPTATAAIPRWVGKFKLEAYQA